MAEQKTVDQKVEEMHRGKRARIYKAWAAGIPNNRIYARYKINTEILECLKKRFDWIELREEERTNLRNAYREECKKKVNEFFKNVCATVIANYTIRAEADKLTTPEVAQLNKTIETFKKIEDQSIDDNDIRMDKVLAATEKKLKQIAQQNVDKISGEEKAREELRKIAEEKEKQRQEENI